jgi:HTH-type transcriptional regulator/antitoxin HipB
MTDISTREGREAWLEDEVTVRLSAQIRTQRHARGWTQAELGRRAGLHQETISRLENLERGDAPPTPATLERIASAMDIGLVIGFRPWSSVGPIASEAIPSWDDDPGLTE